MAEPRVWNVTLRLLALCVMSTVIAMPSVAGERECAAAATDHARAAHTARLDAERLRLETHASTSWTMGVKPAAEACLAQVDVGRRDTCAARVDAFLASLKRVRAELPAGVETVTTACGTRSVTFPATSATVELPEAAAAAELASELRRPPRDHGSLGLAVGLAGATGDDAVGNDVAARRASFEAASHAARLESIERLKELLKMNAASGDVVAEMMLRLADLYYEEGRYQQALEDRDCAAKTGCTSPERTVSQPWLDKSALLFQHILEAYPSFSRADEATFYLGLTLTELGRPTEGVDQLTALVKRYPESRYIPDAYAAIGDYWFATSNPAKAMMAYQRTSMYRDGDKYAYALYKLAWCDENVGEHTQAIETMTRAVAAAEQGGQSALAAEARADLARFSGAAGQ